MCYTAINIEYIRAMKEYEQVIRDKKLMIKGFKIGYYLFIVLIILTFILSGNFVLGYVPRSSSASDVNYSWNSSKLFNSNVPSADDSFNLRNQTSFNGNYKGTYSFDNEIYQTGTDISWVDSKSSNAAVNVIPSFEGHQSVLNFTCSSGTNAYIYQLISETSGIVEFWIYILGIGSGWDNAIYFGSAQQVIYYSTTTHSEYFYNPIVGTYLITSENIAGKWTHFKIAFDYSTDSADIYINGKLDYTCPNLDGTNFQYLRFMDYATNEIFYIDAIGYSWSGYKSHYDFDTIVDTHFDEYISQHSDYWNWNYENATDGYGVNYAHVDYEPDILDDSVILEGNNLSPLNVSNTFLDKTSGSILLKYAFNLSTSIFFLRFYDGTDKDLEVYLIKSGYFGYMSDTTVYLTPLTVLTSYMVNITFDYSIGYFHLRLYKSGAWNDYDVNYVPSTTKVNKIMLGTMSASNCRLSVGYVHYSWNTSGYFINDNLIPQVDNSNLRELDKYNFLFEGFNNALDVGDDNPQGFTDIEATSDVVNVAYNSYESYARAVKIYTNENGFNGLERNFTVSEGNVNVSTWFGFHQLDNSLGNFTLDLYADDGSIVFKIVILQNGTLQYTDDLVNYHSLYDGITTDNSPYFNTYLLNCYLDYDVNMFKITIQEFDFYYDTYSSIHSYYGNLINVNKDGLSKLLIGLNTTSGNYDDVRINNIGIYVNDSSICTGTYAFERFDTNILINETWYSKNQNYFYLSGTGNCSLYISSLHSYSVGNVISQVSSFENINSQSLIRMASGISAVAPSLVFFIVGKNYSLSNLQLEGYYLSDGSNDYYLVYDSSNVLNNESYFYVSNNRLYYTLTSDDNYTEYIKATIDVQNVACNSYFFYVSHVKSNVDFISQLNVFYTSNYVSFVSKTYLTTNNVLLSQDKVLDYFEFIITDDDNSYDGMNVGYFSNMKLVYYPDIDTTLLISNLTGVIPVLILLVVIPVALYLVFKRRFAIIPITEIFTSIFCLAQGLLPLYACIFIWFSCIAYFIVKIKRG